MTYQYIGNNTYRIWLDSKELDLTIDEINQIQTCNFETNDTVESLDELYELIDNLEVQKEDLEDEIKALRADTKLMIKDSDE